ncbi:dihydrolipoyl dehydrogenase [Mesobacillus maritimus]|uniref:dihydrolipoyl dehydrogenase n=1 Tax=Mesobacillus maritimus TaxID=1643336 RepID=UPI00384EE1A2
MKIRNYYQSTKSAGKIGGEKKVPKQKWDVVVIGGGPGGYSAAIRCSQLGLKTMLVEKEDLGGTCLNVGCIPTKSYVHFANTVATIQKAQNIGIQANIEQINLEQFQKNKQGIVKKLTGGVGYLLKSAGVTVEKGLASFLSRHRIRIVKGSDEKVIEADKVIIAVGTSPRQLEILPFNEKSIVSSTGILSMTTLPNHLAIVGGGVVGMEFASIFSQLGVTITVIEQLSDILAMEDEETVKVLKNTLRKRNVQFYTSTAIQSVSQNNSEVTLTLATEDQNSFDLTVDKVLVAAGRKTNTGQLGLEEVGVKTEKGFIVVNDQMETNVPGIFAVGDVTPTWPLAHVAYEEGAIAAENAAIGGKSMSYHAVPRCIYTSPEISAVGLTEKQAKQQYHQVRTVTFPLIANGKAMINGNGIGEGMMKLIFEEKYGEVLGISMVGEGVNELIIEGTLAMQLEATIEELADVIHPHPSLAEGLKELALLATEKPLHFVK